MYHLRYAILLPQGLIKLRFQDRLCIRTRSTQFRPAAPPPHLIRTDADAHAHSAPPRSGVQITPRRSALPAPCLCSRPLWHAALPTSQCLPPDSGSLHRCSKSSLLASEISPPTAGSTFSTMCAAVSTTRRVLHLAHTPRPLHEHTTNKS